MPDEIQEAAVDATEAPAEEVVEAAVEGEAPEAQEEYELPDGTKVDAATLAKEWKENFLPDYTKKAQRLATIDKGDQKPPEAPWKNEDWEPQTYQEVINAAKSAVRMEAQENKDQKDAQAKALNDFVEGEIAELKTLDANVDTDKVMAHASKYKFGSLLPAYQNMKDMQKTATLTEKRVKENINKRSQDAVGTGGSGSPSGVSVPKGMGLAKGAQAYLKQLKGE